MCLLCQYYWQKQWFQDIKEHLCTHKWRTDRWTKYCNTKHTQESDLRRRRSLLYFHEFWDHQGQSLKKYIKSSACLHSQYSNRPRSHWRPYKLHRWNKQYSSQIIRPVLSSIKQRNDIYTIRTFGSQGQWRLAPLWNRKRAITGKNSVNYVLQPINDK